MSWAAMVTQSVSDLRSELRNPTSDRFVGNYDPALGEQVFDVPKTQRKPGIEPDGVLNDRRREVAVSVVDRLHRRSLAERRPWSPRTRDKAHRPTPPARASRRQFT